MPFRSPRFLYISHNKYDRSHANISLVEKYFENLAIDIMRFENF